MNAKETLWQCGIDLDNGANGYAWGSSMGSHFGIAHAIEHAGEEIPSSWGFSHSILCDGTFDDDEDYEAIGVTEAVERGDLTWGAVRHMGDVLHRYESLLERAGRSY